MRRLWWIVSMVFLLIMVIPQAIAWALPTSSMKTRPHERGPTFLSGLVELWTILAATWSLIFGKAHRGEVGHPAAHGAAHTSLVAGAFSIAIVAWTYLVDILESTIGRVTQIPTGIAKLWGIIGNTLDDWLGLGIGTAPHTDTQTQV